MKITTKKQGLEVFSYANFESNTSVFFIDEIPNFGVVKVLKFG